MQKIFSHRKEINFIFTELFIILKIEYPADSKMNNSVKIKLKFSKTEIRALWSKMKFHVFLQKFFNEKF